MLLASKASARERELSLGPTSGDLCTVNKTGLGTLLRVVLDVGRLQQPPKGEEPLKCLCAQPSSTHYPAFSFVQRYGPVVVRMRANHQLRYRCSALAQSRYLCCPTPWFPTISVAARAAFPCRCFPHSL
ncbi:hypothetical protein STEG23_036179 [Scotinomys teguina]